MTGRRLGRLIAAFFTQPVTAARIVALARRLRHGAPAKVPDFEATKMFDRPDPLAGWHPSDSSVEVKEAPLDTLPAELQDELRGTPPRPRT